MAANTLKRRIEAGDPFLKKIHLFGRSLHPSDTPDQLSVYMEHIDECPNVVEVSLMSFDLGSYPRLFEKLNQCPLHTLCLEDCAFSDRAVSDFVKVLKGKLGNTLKHLNIGFATGNIVNILQNIPPGLESLSVHGIDLSSEEVFTSVKVLLGNLSTLILTGTKLTHENAQQLIAKGRTLDEEAKSTLKVLEVSGNSIPPEDLRDLRDVFGASVVCL